MPTGARRDRPESGSHLLRSNSEMGDSLEHSGQRQLAVLELSRSAPEDPALESDWQSAVRSGPSTDDELPPRARHSFPPSRDSRAGTTPSGESRPIAARRAPAENGRPAAQLARVCWLRLR